MLVTCLRAGSSEPLSLQQRQFAPFQLLPTQCARYRTLWLEGMFYCTALAVAKIVGSMASGVVEWKIDE